MPRFDVERCMLCGGCEAVCEKGAIALTPVFLNYKKSKCAECKKCVEVCPVGAWQ